MIVTYLDLDQVRADLTPINQSILRLENHAMQIHSALSNLQMALNDFNVACDGNTTCEGLIPMAPVITGTDNVSSVADTSW